MPESRVTAQQKNDKSDRFVKIARASNQLKTTVVNSAKMLPEETYEYLV